MLISREVSGTKAVEHHSDGSMVEASHYQAGPAGMVIATWDCGASLEVEVPSSRLQDGRIVMTPPPAALRQRPAATYKRPAGSAASSTKQETEVQEELEEAEEEEEDLDLVGDPEFRLQMSIKPGHDEAMCLFLQTSGNDKAQILQVSHTQSCQHRLRSHRGRRALRGSTSARVRKAPSQEGQGTAIQYCAAV